MLNVPYFHGVFTVPDNLNPLALHSLAVFYDLVFRAVAQTLLEIGAHRMGARSAFSRYSIPGASCSRSIRTFTASYRAEALASCTWRCRYRTTRGSPESSILISMVTAYSVADPANGARDAAESMAPGAGL